LGSLALLPILNVDSSFIPGILGPDSENYNLLEQVESEDDFVIASVLRQANASLIFSKSRTINPDFQSATLAFVFPPPKYA